MAVVTGVLVVLLSLDDTSAQATVNAHESSSAGDTGDTTEIVVNPGSAADAGTTSQTVTDGPSVELITGGNSDRGAAHVGRMPVLD